MVIHFACQCGRQFSVDDSKAGMRARCPVCGAILRIPSSEARPLNGADDHQDGAANRSTSPAIRTPGWLLYLGLLTAAAMLWGTLATIRLQERAGQMREALHRADAAEEASKASIAQAEAAKKEAIQQAENIRREAETLKHEAEVARLREEKLLHELYPRIHKLAPDQNRVDEGFLESFLIAGDVVHVELRNTTKESLLPEFAIVFLDRNGVETARANFSWYKTMEPGETSSIEKPFLLNFGQPVYYFVSLKGPKQPSIASLKESSEEHPRPKGSSEEHLGIFEWLGGKIANSMPKDNGDDPAPYFPHIAG